MPSESTLNGTPKQTSAERLLVLLLRLVGHRSDSVSTQVEWVMRTGLDGFDMSQAELGRVESGRYLRAAVYPSAAQPTRSDVRLADSYASLVWALDRTVALPDVAASPYAKMPCYLRRPTRALIGTAVTVHGQPWGTLVFSSDRPRTHGFSDLELTFVEILASFVGSTLELDAADSRLRHRDAEIQRMYHTLCHELKTPLTSMREFVSLLLDGVPGPLNPDQDEYLREVRGGCDDLTRHLNDQIDVSRLDTGKLSCHPKVHDLVEVVERAMEQQRTEAADAGIDLVLAAGPDLPLAWIDGVRVAQVVRNLVANAIRFTPSGGHIGVTVDLNREERLRVSVQDSGLGIPPSEVEQIFDRLYQVGDDELATHGGLGLGLHLSRELVRLHGGELGVRSVLGQGSVFAFSVPAHTPLSAEMPTLMGRH